MRGGDDKPAASSGRGAFTSGDEGRRLTIVRSGAKGQTRKVFVDGVERRVKWGRKVERTAEGLESWLRAHAELPLHAGTTKEEL